MKIRKNMIDPVDNATFVRINGRLKTEPATDNDDVITKGSIESIISSSVNNALSRIRLVNKRQVIARAPFDVSGNSDFLTAGTGLTVKTKNVTLSDPLVLVFSAGYDEVGSIDYVKMISSEVMCSVPDFSSGYLYFTYNPVTGNSELRSTVVKPVYSKIPPSSPAVDQYWYPVDHRSSGMVWDGSSWVPALRLYAGEFTSVSGSVQSVSSYAAGGISFASVVIGPSASFTIPSRQGTIEYSYNSRLRIPVAGGGYAAGDIISIENAYFSNNSQEGFSLFFTENTVTVSTGSWTGGVFSIPAKSGGVHTVTNPELLFTFVRTF